MNKIEIEEAFWFQKGTDPTDSLGSDQAMFNGVMFNGRPQSTQSTHVCFFQCFKSHFVVEMLLVIQGRRIAVSDNAKDHDEAK